METLIELIAHSTFKDLLGGVISILLVLSVFIEIVPVKWNPLSSLFKWIGKKINGEVVQKVDSLQKQVNTIQYDNARRSAVNCRIRILSFGDEIRQGMKHSKENFDQVIEDIDNYEQYCQNHPEFKNNRTQLTTQRILEAYGHSMDNNDFL